MTQISSSEAMLRAIYIARKGKYRVHPNPLVGCVILLDGKLIAEGWHSEYGKAHAEVNAVKNIPEEYWSNIHNMEVYVTLEPCAHTGKTPPCAELLVNQGFRKVFVASLDPNPSTAGKGIALLKQAGIQVEIGLHEEKAKALNLAFFEFHGKKSTYIVAKHAETANRIFGIQGEELAISSYMGRLYGHQLRTTYEAILVGTNTLKADQPNLTSRLWKGKQPVRLVIDMELKYPELYPESISESPVRPICRTDLAEMLPVAIPWSGSWKDLPAALYQAGFQSVLIEGGSYVLNNMLEYNLLHEYHIIRSSQVINDKNSIDAPRVNYLVNKQFQYDTDSIYIFQP